MRKKIYGTNFIFKKQRIKTKNYRIQNSESFRMWKYTKKKTVKRLTKNCAKLFELELRSILKENLELSAKRRHRSNKKKCAKCRNSEMCELAVV